MSLEIILKFLNHSFISVAISMLNLEAIDKNKAFGLVYFFKSSASLHPLLILILSQSGAFLINKSAFDLILLWSHSLLIVPFKI